MKRVSTILLLFASMILFTQCEKEGGSSKDFGPDIFQDNYQWIENATTDCYMQIASDTSCASVLINKVTLFFDSLLTLHNLQIPDADSISISEKPFYNRMNASFFAYGHQYDALMTNFQSIHDDIIHSVLSSQEKIRLCVYYYTFLGISKAYSSMNMPEDKRQFPRNHYNSSEGGSRWERQLNSCMQYQIDGHFETTAGTIFYILGMPASAIHDAIICGEEIHDGLWNHVS
ncbi:MAG: hypothetical protein J6T59_03030 [Bacteroidales bacterium]|nr:hypothetical protein [Bacteroidales bacterium]